MMTCTGPWWDRFVAGRSGKNKNWCLRMDQLAAPINRQNREDRHGENPHTKIALGVPGSHKCREIINLANPNQINSDIRGIKITNKTIIVSRQSETRLG